jgi:hypothetical protein
MNSTREESQNGIKVSNVDSTADVQAAIGKKNSKLIKFF